jgi:hypothetical protein
LRARSAEKAATLVVDRINSLPNPFRRTNLKPPAKPTATIRSDSTGAFTFAQFKSAVVRPGTKVAESELRKSYSGLMQLQKNKNWSAADIRATLKRVQELLPSQSTRRTQRNRLPITERDWRKIA